MKRSVAGIIALCLLAQLGACAKPTTMRPVTYASEVEQEAKYQQEYVQHAGQITTGQAQDYQIRLNRVEARLNPALQNMCGEMSLRNCTYPVNLAKQEMDGNNKPILNAYADGSAVYFTPAMVAFAAQDEELALIMAHEYAHNMMAHVDSKKKNTLFGAAIGIVADLALSTQGINTDGQLTQLGASAGSNAYSPDFESEADYIALYMLARAGFDYTKSAEFWRKMSVNNPNAIYTTTTHPSNSARFVQMQKTMDEIQRKRNANQPLVPEFQKGN